MFIQKAVITFEVVFRTFAENKSFYVWTVKHIKGIDLTLIFRFIINCDANP